MTPVNEVIIVGGGKSIREGIKIGLKNKLKDKFTITCNYAFKHFLGTFLAFTDRDFYKPRPEANNPDIYEELRQLPLIISIDDNGLDEFKLDNTILLHKNYREVLTGMFALKLAEELIGSGTIFLLGFDWTRRTGLPERDPNYSAKSNLQIHYYNDIKHRGLGYMGYYENHNSDKLFEKFIKKDIKVYNVSLESNINCFQKISYDTMFSLLNKEEVNQEELRDYIRLFYSKT